MSPIPKSSRRRTQTTSGKRVPYKAPRPRRELVTAILVGALIVIATASLVWFLRPNREATSTPVLTVPTTTLAPTATTLAPTGTTAPADTTSPADTSGGGGG